MKRVLKIFGLLFLMCLFLTGCGNNYLLEDVPVEIKGYNKDAYVVEGYEKTVDVTISGEQSDIDKIKKSKKNKVVLDLEDYDKTDKAKKFEYVFETDAINNFDSYKVNPESVNITLYEKVSQTIYLNSRVVNLSKLDSNLGIKSIVLDKGAVIVRGSQSALDKIEKADAIIDIENLDINKVGIYNYSDAEIKYFDSDGNEVTDVEILTTKTSAKIEIYKGENLYNKESTKSVPLKINLTGELINGFAVDKILINEMSYENFMVDITGKGIQDIESVPISIDVHGQGNNSSKEYNITLAKPSNVDKITFKGKPINNARVKLTFGEAKQKTVFVSGISAQNVPSGMSANIMNIEDAKSDVQVIGVEEKLKNLSASDVKLYVDLTGYTTGTHEVELRAVTNDPTLMLVPVKTKIYVCISNRGW